MDVGDFVGDSDEDSEVENVPNGLENVPNGLETPISVVNDHFAPPEIVLDAEIKSTVGNVEQDVALADSSKSSEQEADAARLQVGLEPTALATVPVDEHETSNVSVDQASPTPGISVSGLDEPEPTVETDDFQERLHVEPPAKSIPQATEERLAEVVLENSPEPREEEHAGPRAKFKIGDIVHVAARTWPGINKLGGAGKIASVAMEMAESDGFVEFLYNVKYMLGGFEKRIEEEFIQDLADALETGVRQHKERVFYHDEFAVNSHKKAKPLELESGEFWPQPADSADGGKTATEPATMSAAPLLNKPKKKKEKKSREKPVLVDAPEIEFELRSSDDSDYDGSEDAEMKEREERTPGPRLDDGSFILGERHTAATQRKPHPRDPEARKQRREKKQTTRHRHKENDESRHHESRRAHARKKRSHRIIESDDDEEDEGQEVVDGGERSGEIRRGKKKRRYIGGYEHGSGDADGSFIQPEGNPADLPDDVAEELQFTMGKTKAELRSQLNDVADKLLENMSEFEKMKRLVSRKLDHAATLDENELHDVNRELLNLEAFIRANFIRSGEDAMNQIIKVLEKKRSRLPERIDLQYEEWKAVISGHDMWVKQSLRVLETTFARRGLLSNFKEDLSDEETSSDSGESDDFESANSDTNDSTGDGFASIGRNSPRQMDKYTPQRQRDHVDRTNHTSTKNDPVSKKRPRSNLRTQSSMDSYAVSFDDRLRREQFDRPSAPAMTNFRFVREKDLKKLMVDPRWDWVRKLKRTKASELASRSSPSGSLPRQPTAYPSAHNKKPKETQASVSVMEAVLKLRDKRFRSTSRPQAFQPHPQVARSAMLPIRSLPPHQQPASQRSYPFEYGQPPSSRKTGIPFKDPSPGSIPQQQSREWSVIFSVLPDEETLPSTHVVSSAELMRLGRVMYEHNDIRDDEGECWLVASDELLADRQFVTHQGSVLRQKLALLRFKEQQALQSVMESGGESSYKENACWVSTSSLGDEYHTDLVAFVEDLQSVVQAAHPEEVVSLTRAMILELAELLKQIPDCNSIFNESLTYGYYFEVACPGASTSPLITAICRTYWYAIQALVWVKQACEKLWPDKGAEWNELLLGVLPPNRVALAACLFLVDLYVHVHSTHHLASDQIPTEGLESTGAPALSLWLLLHELFTVGLLQSVKVDDKRANSNSTVKGNETKVNGGFWNFLQGAYRNRFVNELAASFVKRSSCGGYMKERAPSKVNHQDRSDEDLQGQLLATDTLWDICGVLALVFQSTARSSSNPSTDSAWTLVKALLPATTPGVPPFDVLSETDKSDDEFKLQAYGFELRVLRRLHVFSATWPPDNDLLVRLLPHLLESSLEEESEEVMVSVVSFIGELRGLRDKTSGTSLLDFAHRHSSQTTNAVSLFCKIVMIQLSKQEKAIHRSRFRQPVLRVISTRLETQRAGRVAMAQSLLQSKKEQEQITTAKKDANKSWNWGKSGSSAAASTTTPPKNLSVTAPVQIAGPLPEQIVAEAKTMLSILLMFALSSMHLDDDAGAAQQTARRQKELKREIEYFCKELSSVGSGIPATCAQLGQCILAIGLAALDLRSSYSTAFEHLDDLLKWASTELQQARRVQGESKIQPARESPSLIAGISSCLQALLNLSSLLATRLRVRRDIDPVEIETVQSCVSSALGGGIAASLDLAADGALPLPDLDNAVEILTLWLPRTRDVPSQSLRYGPSLVADDATHDEFDEFDDDAMMDLLATVDLTNAGASANDYEAFLRAIETQASEAAVANLRLPLQRLLLSLPQEMWRSYQELYLMDLLGAMIASRSFTFSWSVVSTASLKPRMFAPRLLSAILKHRPEKEWFSTCFLSDQNVDVELSSMWITATLDLRSLLSTVSTFAPSNAGETRSSHDANNARYSSYWLMLTDGILANLLKENTVVRYKMDQLMYQLLHDTATQCSFRQSIQRCADPVETGSLYAMHVDVFRTFCRSANHIWTRLSADPARYRPDMNRFRTKMMDAQRGVFVALPEAYEINLRSVCMELDRKPVNWYSLSSRFLDEFRAPHGVKSLHAVDDAATVLDRELTDPVIRPLVVLFKLMYDCVDAFLFNCGGMAIGQQNIFYSVIELMFRQARCAEFPVAERRLKQNSNVPASLVVKPSASTGIPGISQACAGFVESARLFFAYQKYPSLLNWFAQNLETYQTLKAGWSTSPLRVLLYNIFDPHGPLGIHSYYPIQDASREDSLFDPSAIRREAFYFSCGLVNCRCTDSYEHARQAQQVDQETRRAHLRQFILTQFVDELKRCVQVDGEDLDETLLPVLQFVKALVHHLNLDNQSNVQAQDRTRSWPLLSPAQELLPCLVRVAEHIISKLQVDSALGDTMSCVLLIEFCRIVEEVALLNSVLHDTKLTQFVHIGLRCAGVAYAALRKYSSSPLEELFADECSTPLNAEALANTLQSLVDPNDMMVKTEQGVGGVKIEARAATASHRNSPEDYGISKVRVRSDLLASIRRLTKQCVALGDTTLLRSSPPAPEPPAQVSGVGTM